MKDDTHGGEAEESGGSLQSDPAHGVSSCKHLLRTFSPAPSHPSLSSTLDLNLPLP